MYSLPKKRDIFRWQNMISQQIVKVIDAIRGVDVSNSNLFGGASLKKDDT